MNDDIIAFLQESNYIEGVVDGLDQAVKAWKYIITKKELTKAIILKTHAILMRDKLDHEYLGAWRKEEVFIGGHKAKPWYAVPELMEEWIKTANIMIQYPSSLPKRQEEDYKQHHIKFESIHPFIDGNGRMGRILLNWQRVKAGLPILVILESEKWDYYKWFK